MGIFSRIRDVLTGRTHAALDRMENPEAMINQYLRDMELELQNAEGALIKQMAYESRIKKQLDQQEWIVKTRTEQAELALNAGNEGLARQAIEAKQQAEQMVLELKEQHEQATTQVNSFKSQLGDLQHEYTKLKSKRQQLIARYGHAKALTQMQKAMSKTGMGSSIANFDRMANRIEDMEAEALARYHVRNEKPDIDVDFRKLSNNAAVELELEALKARLNPAQ